MAIGDECTGTWKNTYRFYDEYRHYDERKDSDSSFFGTHSNRTTTSSTYSDEDVSLGCITPGTAVQLTDPGQVISVRSMDDVGRIDAMRFQLLLDPEHVISENVRRQTATEARIAHEAALNRAQAAMQQQAVRSVWGDCLQQVELRRAMGLREGESMAEVLQAQTAAQQQAVLTQRDLERAVEQISGMRSAELGAGEVQQRPHLVPDRVLGALWNEAQGTDPACDTYRYRVPELGEFRDPQEPYQQIPWDPQEPCQPRPQHPEYHPQDQPVPCPPTYSEEYLAQGKKREKAEERAQELLGYMIGEKQIEVYKRTSKLFVRGKKYDYIIQKGGYILQLKKNKVINLCVHLEKRYVMPLTDDVIAMKLRIENEEKEVLKLANEWGEHDRETYALPACAGMV